MSAITQTQATSGQIKQISRFGSDAIDKVLAELNLDKPCAQRVIEHGDKFVEAIRVAAINSLRDLSAEEVAPTRRYESIVPKEIWRKIISFCEVEAKTENQIVAHLGLSKEEVGHYMDEMAYSVLGWMGITSTGESKWLTNDGLMKVCSKLPLPKDGIARSSEELVALLLRG